MALLLPGSLHSEFPPFLFQHTSKRSGSGSGHAGTLHYSRAAPPSARRKWKHVHQYYRMISHFVNAIRDRTNRHRDTAESAAEGMERENVSPTETNEELSGYEVDTSLPHLDCSDLSSRPRSPDDASAVLSAQDTSIPEMWSSQCALPMLCPFKPRFFSLNRTAVAALTD